MNTIEVLALGTHVTIDGDIPAVIRGITIYSLTHVKYNCVWWDERNRREEWLSIEEINVSEQSTATIRFK